MKKLHTPFICVLVASLLVSACGGGGSSDGGTSADNASAPVAEESLPDINYTAALLPLMVGSYTGTKCLKMPSGMDSQNSSETLSITAEGDVKLADTQVNILSNDTGLIFIRNFDAGEVVESSYSAIDGSEKTYLHLGLTSRESAGFGMFTGKPSEGTQCAGTSDTDALKTKSLYSAVSKYMDAQEFTMNCLVKGEIMTIPTIKIDKGEVVFNGENYSLFNGLKEEFIQSTSRNGDQGITYFSKAMDGRIFSETFNRKGKLLGLMYQSSTSIHSCFPKP
jgi:hypothetical protein